MKKKMSVVAVLLFCAACLWAAVPEQVSFMGEVFRFSKTEGDLTHFVSKDGNLFIFSPQAFKDPVNTAIIDKNRETFGNNAFLEYCNDDDVILQVTINNSIYYHLLLRRYTKQGALAISVAHTSLSTKPDSYYRQALCQFDINTLK